ncbi:mechanosensitive ion channel family protein [bacterium]|nr:MAG: mechanosensitive ion channel family protein [bacterium]
MLGINWNELLDSVVLAVGRWLITGGIRVIVYIVAGITVIKTVQKIGKSIVRKVEDEDDSTRSERERRADTLFQVVQVSTRIFVWVIVGFMILRELGANITPLLTGAGVIGLAIGFGAQNIVRDFFNGFLILLENQYRVGDVVRIADKSGLVESINLRTTAIRDLEGVVHIIPNGEIKTVDNMTFSESRAVIDVGISYNSSVDKAFEVINKTGDELKADSELGSYIREFGILGVENLGESSVDIRVLIKTDPLQQWAVARKFKYLIKKRFDEAGIEIPFPHRTIYTRTEMK